MMLRLFENRTVEAQQEKGIVLVMMSIVVVVLLALAGLAIDAGNLYRHSLSLQKAADAAVLAAVGYTIQLTEDEKTAAETALSLSYDVNHEQLIEAKAQEAFEENLRLMDPGSLGSYVCPADGCFHYDGTTRQVTATVQESVDMLLMDAVPFELLGGSRIADTAQVSANATARRNPAYISLLFDVSGSMACGANVANCDCRKDPAGCFLPNFEVKIDTLEKAVEVFLNYFNTDDKLAITPFSMRAMTMTIANQTELATFKQLVQNTTIKDAVINCILAGHSISYCASSGFNSGTEPASNTNLCEALTDSYDAQKIMQQSNPNQETAYVAFIDGAPSAATIQYAYPSATLPKNDHTGRYPNSYTYLTFRTHWVPPPSSMITTPYDGPSLMIKPQSLYLHWPAPVPPDPDPSVKGVHVPVCHKYADPTTPSVISEKYAPWDSKEFYKVFRGCLTDQSGQVDAVPSLGFKLPDSNGIYAANLKGGSPTVTPESDKLYYLCPLAMADVIRKHKGTLYVVGVGSPATVGTDAYQDPSQWYLRKDVFGAKLANDKSFAVDQQLAVGLPVHPEDWNPGSPSDVMSYTSWEAESSPRFGHYFPSPTVEQLHNIYRTMAKQIAMRLIQ